MAERYAFNTSVCLVSPRRYVNLLHNPGDKVEANCRASFCKHFWSVCPVTLFNSVTGKADQKCLQKLARQFASTLSPGLCNKFTYLRGDTRHTDVLNGYLSAILTLQLFALHHKEYSCFFYKTSHVAWAKYGSDEIYKELVLEPNGFDLVNAPEEAAGPGPGPAIDLRSQRKRFRPDLVMLN